MPKFHSPAAEEIGRRVRAARNQRKISLEDLGHLSDVNGTTIGKIERGVSSPSVESVVRIAAALEIDPGMLISGITATDYGDSQHQLTARDLIDARRGSSS